MPTASDLKLALHNLDADERERYEERAAICEYHGGLDRVAAERLALGEILEARERMQAQRSLFR